MEKIEWKAPEYYCKEKTADWYWIVGIVSVSVSVISIILGDLIFGIFILVAVFTMSLYATKKPKIVKIILDNEAISVDDKENQYSEFSSFWVEDRYFYPRIFLTPKKGIIKNVIMIENENPKNIREFLKKHLPEKEYNEPFLEKLLIYLGF